MRTKQKLRLVTDGAMLLLLVLLMGYGLTGGELHEWLGLGVTLVVGLHLWLNAAWFKALLQGKYRWRRVVATSVNLLLVLTLLGLILAAMPISGTLFPFVKLFSEYAWPSQLHITLSNWFLVLSALHLGMQWGRVQPHLPRPLVASALSRWALYLLATYGLWAMWTRRLHEKLVFYSSFDFARFDATWLGLIVDYFAIFACLALSSQRLLVKQPKRSKRSA